MFWYLDHSGQRIEKSVWAGVSRDTLSFRDVTALSKGCILTRDVSNRFIKSIINLTIAAKDTEITF